MLYAVTGTPLSYTGAGSPVHTSPDRTAMAAALSVSLLQPANPRAESPPRAHMHTQMWALLLQPALSLL